MAFLSTLKQRNLLLLLLAQMVSNIGSIMQTMALSLYVLSFASEVQFATVLAVGMLPRLFGPLTGVLTDRLNRKSLLIVFDVAAGFLTLAFAMAYEFMGGLPLWMIYVLVLSLSAVQTFSDPAAGAILPDIVSPDHLEEANSANSFVTNASYIAMPALAGILYGSSGLLPVMLINALSFFTAAFTEAFIRYHPQPHIEKAKGEPFLHSLREGFRVYRGNIELILLIVISIAVNFTLNPVLTVALPYVLKVDLNVSSQVYGFSQSMLFIGPVLGSLAAGFLLKKINYKRVIVAILLLDSVLVLALGVLSRAGLLQYNLMQVLLLNVCAFFIVSTMVLGGIACMSTVQRIVPPELMGRVMGVDTALSVAAIPVGQWLIGWGMNAGGSFAACAAFAVLVLAVGVVSLVRYHPMLRQESRSAAAAQTPAD